MTAQTPTTPPESAASAEARAALARYVNGRIAALRPRLLDLTRRNPLLATPLSPRSLTQLRIIDQPLARIAQLLGQGERLEFTPLPDLELDPLDEESADFQQALAAARLTDEIYLQALAAAEGRADEDPNLQRQLERALRDRLRDALGWPPRQRGTELSLEQHARNHGIAPAVELPVADPPGTAREAGDKRLQTLLLRPELTRKLGALLGKSAEFTEETGVPVLHAALGFLEWQEPGQSRPALAPLLLMPVEIHRHTGRQGLVFRVTAAVDEPEPNLVLAEFLKQQFGLDLPTFEAGQIEAYFSALTAALRERPQWKLRRQATVGIFPSARMVMYYDLDTSSFDFAQNDNLRRLFGGSEEGGHSGYAADYPVDDPDIERKVPLLVMDADSSQFSTLVDVADGKSIAVEGPPGTGKSQTIVNAIAAALAAGKKVLFVAEKMAALDVVKSRLEAIGLGEFVLALQAGSASRSAVVKSLRARLALNRSAERDDLDERLRRYRATRDRLAAYLATLAAPFAQTGLTVHEILARCIAASPVVETLPEALRGLSLPGVDALSAAELEARCAAVAALANALREVSELPAHWRGVGVTQVNPFLIDELLQQATAAGAALEGLSSAQDALSSLGLPPAVDYPALASVLPHWIALRDRQQAILLPVLEGALAGHSSAELLAFLDACERLQAERAALAALLPQLDDADLPQQLRTLADCCTQSAVVLPDLSAFEQRIAQEAEQLKRTEDLIRGLRRLLLELPATERLPLTALAQAAALLRDCPPAALAVRQPALQEPIARQALRGIVITIRRQAERRQALHKVFDLAGSHSPEELADHAATLRAGGALAFLSPAWRRAKQAYLRGSRRPQFVLAAAVSDLHQVGEWKAAERALRDDSRVGALLGPLFDGSHTDCAAVETLLDFLERVDEALPGSHQRELRQFLHTGAQDALRLLQQLEFAAHEGDLAALIARQAAQRAGLNEAQETLAVMQRLAVLWQGGPASPTALEDAAARVEQLRAGERALGADGRMAALLGPQFAGAATEVVALRATCETLRFLAGHGDDGGPYLERLRDGRTPAVVAALEAVIDGHQHALVAIGALGAAAGRQWPVDFAPSEVAGYAADLQATARDRAGLQANIVYAGHRQTVAAGGDLAICDQLLQSGVAPADLAGACRAVLWRALSRAVYAVHGEQLSAYTGTQLDELRARLASLDREIQMLSRRRLREQLLRAAAPPRGIGVGPRSAWTEMSLLNNETEKRKAWLPVRQLTARAGAALRALKPCWMMSPQAVAQYIQRDAPPFDLCIIDEASQMPPEDAVGAIARAAQVMVVGDTNQLPPTSFFARLQTADEDDEDGAPVEESILEVANGAFRPARRLRWHYRSRHSALIQFCNHEIYDDALIVFPGAAEARPGMGVHLVPVAGCYKGSVNPVEAQVMVDHAIAFMRQRPDRSLGIVTLNQKQRELIETELEARLAEDAQARLYVAHWAQERGGLEKFFIKNLENVQGDERDVIFIGTVYGPEKPGGPVHARFGPINGQAGRRRLNVLLTRARDQLVTFSSMTPANFPGEDRSNPGAAMLKAWLAYAGSGRLHGGAGSGRAPDSDFEDFVAAQIRALGFDAVPQVGVAGYFIDIGVRHPDWPYGFVLGVECDGASFHSARSARDRDRLRAQVLEGLGWSLHRIWSTDWFQHPAREIARLKLSMDARLAALLSAPPEAAPTLAASAPADSAAMPGQLGLFGVGTLQLIDERLAPDAGEGDDSEDEPPGADEDETEETGSDEQGPIDEDTLDAPELGPRSYAGLLPELQAALDADAFYDPAYNRRLRAFALAVIDAIGPVTEAQLCEIVARCHLFARTGRRIRQRVLKLVDGHRPYVEETRDSGSYWPEGATPVAVMAFRGLKLGAVPRGWKDLPLPERLGLARRALEARATRREQIEFMQRELKLARLSQPTASALGSALEAMTRRAAGGG